MMIYALDDLTQPVWLYGALKNWDFDRNNHMCGKIYIKAFQVYTSLLNFANN